MPLIVTHHHTLENGLEAGDDEYLSERDSISRTNQQNMQPSAPRQVCLMANYKRFLVGIKLIGQMHLVLKTGSSHKHLVSLLLKD